MKACPTCGEENPERFRICGICGTALELAVSAPQSRRTVTVVFCDLKDSTVLSERLDIEPLHEVLGSYFAAMQDAIQAHGGTVEKYIGDAIMAVFGMPTAHEDDALRAVRAASEMRARLVGLNDDLERQWGVRLENRTGVNTGEVVASDATSMQRLVTGSTVNMAARLEQAASTSEILLGEATYALVRDAVEVDRADALMLKGIADPVSAYRLIAVTGRAGIARRPGAQIVGRHQELEVLQDAFRRARENGASRPLTIIGPAGAGKSRLLDEFLASADDSTILRGGCLSYGQGITFWPLIEAIRSAAKIDDGMSIADARARLGGLCAAQTDIEERLALREAVEHARLAGDRRAVTRNQMSFAIAALYGPMPVPEAVRLCEQIVADVGGDRRAEGVVLGAMAHLNATAGEFELARQQYGRARQILEDLGGRLMAATVSLDSGRVELLAGRPDSAERELRHDYDILLEIDERYALSTVAALLAAAVHQQGRTEEALVLTVASEDAAAEDDVESQNLWRRVRASILAELGRGDEALSLSDEALRLVEPTDAPLLRAGTLLDRATVQLALGRKAEAATAAGGALAIYQAKQDLVDTARAEALLVELRR